jgi:hypothetical protein
VSAAERFVQNANKSNRVAQGTFNDPRLGINITQTPDLVTSKLTALREYQLSLSVPKPTVDASTAACGQAGSLSTRHISTTEAPRRSPTSSIITIDSCRSG